MEFIFRNLWEHSLLASLAIQAVDRWEVGARRVSCGVARPTRAAGAKLAGLGQLRTSALSDSDGPTAHQQQPNSYVGLFAVVVRKGHLAVVVF